MAYYNNYNGGYKKNRYYKNNNQKYNNNKPQSRPAQFNGFDATQYKKPDIEIKDLNGKVYKISGNFSSEFSAKLLAKIDEINGIKGMAKDVKNFPEIFSISKDFCVDIINCNIDGITYTWDDIKTGFNDVNVLYNLMGYISRIITAENAQRLNNAN